MANIDRKLAKPSLIPLEIEPASILSLSKGVIFDTIVHNIEYTLNNRRKEPLPWKLIGMSLICDPSRNKKYMQKLQKMQCVPSVICTQIYHSKLVKSEAGVLTTPGRKIILPTVPRKRLTGIFVCRSIDELLYMETANNENVHFIQYKLLSYERIATRELINGPKLSSVGDKIIKTVFDFELSQQYDFPRQLLPVAIITFGRQDGCDLCLSIRDFLKLDEHKVFDKSYLVTSINVEMDRLREEQERKEDAEAEQDSFWEKIQRRQPLADLSKKSTDTGNARPIPPPVSRPSSLTIKLPRSEKPLKATLFTQPVDTKFQCLLKLDRVDLSSYDISNLSNISQIKPKPPTTSPSSSESLKIKIKPLIITKPHEHQKPLKRLNNTEIKKKVLSPTEISKVKPTKDVTTVHSSSSDSNLTLQKNNTTQIRSASTSTMSPVYTPKTVAGKQLEKTVTKKKVKRPVLPSDYHCSISLSRIDLSIYNLDLPPIPSPPMEIQSTVISSPSNSTLSDLQSEPMDTSVKPALDVVQLTPVTEQNSVHESEIQNIFDTHSDQTFSNILEEFSTPDLNEPELHTENDNSSETIDEPTLNVMNETIPVMINTIVSDDTSEVNPNNESIVTNQDLMSTSLTSHVSLSPVISPLEELPANEELQATNSDNLNITPQDYIIIVPCSDDDDDDLDDDDDTDLINLIRNSTIDKDLDTKVAMSACSPPKLDTSSPLRNPSLTRVLVNTNFLTSHRLSTSSSSSCSSISTSIFHHQNLQTPLSLTEISLPQKILNKKQRKPSQPIIFNRFDLCIPIITQESLIDPRLIYRLQTITTDLRWPSPCNQCSVSSHLPPLFGSSTQTILYDRKCSTDFVDPRREPLKNAILNSIYQRLKILIPNIFLIHSNQFQKLLFEETIFRTNCSLHLEYLLHKIKRTDDTSFFQMIKTTDEFQLSSYVLELIFT